MKLKNIQLNDGEVDATSLFEVTRGKETTMLFFTHPRTLDLREAREQKVYVLVRNEDSTIKCFERNVKIGTDEEIASSKVYEKKVETAVNAGSDKKKESNTTTSSNTSANQPQQSTAQTTQQQTTYTPANSQPAAQQPTQTYTNTQPSAPAQPAHVHSWVPQYKTVHHDAVYQQKYIVDVGASTQQKCVRSDYVCGKCGQHFFDIEAITDHILDVCMSNYGVVCGEYTTITIPEQGHYENVLVSNAWDESVLTGYRCNCGASK